jgi:hypothetical protein
MLQFENAEEQIREFARLFFRLAASRQLDLACRMPDERVRLSGPEKLILLARALAISA